MPSKCVRWMLLFTYCVQRNRNYFSRYRLKSAGHLSRHDIDHIRLSTIDIPSMVPIAVAEVISAQDAYVFDWLQSSA
jgi:hypothetical protein